MATVLNSIVPERDKVVAWYRDLDGNLQAGYDPNVTGYNHGDTFVFTDAALGSKTVTQRGFLGGAGGYIETLANGASTTNTSTWEFFYDGAGEAWTGATDSVRGKVLNNDYTGQIDAIISVNCASPVPQNTEVFWCYQVLPEVRDAGGSYVPNSDSKQWKIGRGLQSVKTITDSNDNSRIEQFTAVQYGGAGLTTRIENAAGVATGTITSATNNQLTASGASLTPNVFTDFLVDITKTSNGTHQYARASSNTATVVNLASTITTPTAGDTFSVGQDASQKYGDSTNLPLLNTDWILIEASTFTGTQGSTDGEFFVSTSQNGTFAKIEHTNVPIYGSATRGNYIPLCQGWIGNSSPTAIASRNMKAADVYFQIGSTKRIYIVDNLDFEAATVKEFQYDDTWTSGEASITVNNPTGLAGERYLVAVEGLSTVIASTTINLTGN